MADARHPTSNSMCTLAHVRPASCLKNVQRLRRRFIRRSYTLVSVLRLSLSLSLSLSRARARDRPSPCPRTPNSSKSICFRSPGKREIRRASASSFRVRAARLCSRVTSKYNRGESLVKKARRRNLHYCPRERYQVISEFIADNRISKKLEKAVQAETFRVERSRMSGGAATRRDNFTRDDGERKRIAGAEKYTAEIKSSKRGTVKVYGERKLEEAEWVSLVGEQARRGLARN